MLLLLASTLAGTAASGAAGLQAGGAAAPQPQPRAEDFCAADACACPWKGKLFDIPEAGGIGPVLGGGYIPYPETYVAYKVGPDDRLIVDGRLDDPAWQEVAFTDDFKDISNPNPGRGPATPPLRT
eukprot:SAG22_NODE_9223_length_602_cov_0.769384_1_plen_125_part_10